MTGMLYKDEVYARISYNLQYEESSSILSHVIYVNYLKSITKLISVGRKKLAKNQHAKTTNIV